jgi:glycosyltransferase involved in cell wall biosynthesis
MSASDGDQGGRVGFVSQPWASVEPPSESVAIWTREVARRLPPATRPLVYARHLEGASEADGVGLRPLGAESDWRLLRLLEPTARLRPRRRPLFASRAYHRGYWRAAARAAAADGCRLVHVHNFTQPLPRLRSVLPGSKLVLHMHCDWLTQLDPRIVRRRTAAADLVLTPSDYLTLRARRALPRTRCETLANGVDLDAFRPGPPSDAPLLLFAGRISPDKGVHVLLDAMAGVVERRPDARLELVGDEALPAPEMQVSLDEQPRVRALARFYRRGGYLAPLLARLPEQVARAVSHSPWVDHGAMPARYRGPAMLVAPSVCEEPFGMPVVEAMASGLPVVACAVGGIPEVVAHGETGLLVPPDDPNRLAAAILELLGDPERARRLGARGRHTAEHRFGWDGLVSELLRRYDELGPARS